MWRTLVSAWGLREPKSTAEVGTEAFAVFLLLAFRRFLDVPSAGAILALTGPASVLQELLLLPAVPAVPALLSVSES